MVALDAVDLVIMDECHHASSAESDHPYNGIARWLDLARTQRQHVPHLLGLTASPAFTGRLNEAAIWRALDELEATLSASIQTATDEEVSAALSRPCPCLTSHGHVPARRSQPTYRPR
jgi:ERCC4-related helicase